MNAPVTRLVRTFVVKSLCLGYLQREAFTRSASTYRIVGHKIRAVVNDLPVSYRSAQQQVQWVCCYNETSQPVNILLYKFTQSASQKLKLP